MRPSLRRMLNSLCPPGPTSTAGARSSERSPAPAFPALEKAWTNYLSWLSFANAGMLDRGNIDAFNFVADRRHGPAALRGGGPQGVEGRRGAAHTDIDDDDGGRVGVRELAAQVRRRSYTNSSLCFVKQSISTSTSC